MSLVEDTKPYLVSYRHEGAEWNIELHARDWEDAKARLARLPYATIDGEVALVLPAPAGPLAPIIVAVRNGLRRLLSP